MPLSPSILFLAVLCGVGSSAEPIQSQDVLHCDVFIAGGSAAALAAAITAAEAEPQLLVCLTEPTDWPGGQLTSSAVSAMDFGNANIHPCNQPRSFRDLMAFLSRRRSACWVSKTCYEPQDLVEGWVLPRLARAQNLRVLYRTVVRQVVRSRATGVVEMVQCVQRSPRLGVDEWSLRLSSALSDWYSPVDSKDFQKRSIDARATIFLDASELGDILVLGELGLTQGVELPTETSGSTDDQCGQAATFTFYMELLQSSPAVPDPAPPGSSCGEPFSSSGCCCPASVSEPHSKNCTWAGVWTYRRAGIPANGSTDDAAVNIGDVSQQNWGPGNDLNNAYIFVGVEQARRAARAGNWSGGVNLTALFMLEERAFGWFHAFRKAAPASLAARLVLQRRISGTGTGLAKLPYLRDTRRSIGLSGFRMEHSAQVAGTGRAQYGFRYNDTVALANYPSDCHAIDTCTLPAYMRGASATTLPFYIPFRALTNRDSPNVLVAGKTMAMSFFANSAARLHPAEWSSGVAAGAVAVMMVRRGWNSTQVVSDHMDELRSFLTSPAVGQVLEWSPETLNDAVV